MRQKLGESGVEACWRRGLRLREIQIITEIWKTAFLPRWTSFHLFFRYPPAKSTRPRSPCPFISSSRPSSSDPLSVWLFYPLMLPPLFTSPQTHSPSSQVSSSSFISICSLLSYVSFSLSPLPLSLRPINNSWERRCLTVDSLTPIKADTLKPTLLRLPWLMFIA